MAPSRSALLVVMLVARGSVADSPRLSLAGGVGVGYLSSKTGEGEQQEAAKLASLEIGVRVKHVTLGVGGLIALSERLERTALLGPTVRLRGRVWVGLCLGAIVAARGELPGFGIDARVGGALPLGRHVTGELSAGVTGGSYDVDPRRKLTMFGSLVGVRW